MVLFLVYTCYYLCLRLTTEKYEARKAQGIVEDTLYLLSYSNLLIDMLTSINPSCILESVLLEAGYLVALPNLTLKCLP